MKGEAGSATAGARASKRWIQHFVNERADLLDAAITEASRGRLKAPIRWKSPLEADGHAEYRDTRFLRELDIELPVRPLDDFWPSGGPHWDALGLSASDEPVLVEAKANIPEMVSSASKAKEPSLTKIRAALDETSRFLRAKPGCDWTQRFYQYANRLAHLYFLREVNGVPAWLVFVCFVNDPDMKGPTSEAEWRAAIRVLEAGLGINASHPLHRHTVDVFIDVADWA